MNEIFEKIEINRLFVLVEHKSKTVSFKKVSRTYAHLNSTIEKSSTQQSERHSSLTSCHSESDSAI